MVGVVWEILIYPEIGRENFFYKMFYQGVQNGFSKQKMELFIKFTGLWSKKLLFIILTNKLKIDFKTGIIQTGNKNIYTTFSRPLIRKLLWQNVSHFYQGLQNWFLKQDMELFKQEMGLFLPLPVLWSKNFFNKNFLIST